MMHNLITCLPVSLAEARWDQPFEEPPTRHGLRGAGPTSGGVLLGERWGWSGTGAIGIRAACRSPTSEVSIGRHGWDVG